ncbi:MAG: amidohydrolase family protein [Actinomycetota bacterium]|nr:amidohydrolase family protein [Actinomycetota bacterium]
MQKGVIALRIIDTHSQLWTKEAIASMPEDMRDSHIRIFGNNLPTIADTIADMDESGVEKSVIVAIDAETKWNYRVSNEMVAEAVSSNPDRFIGFASVDPNKGKIAERELRHAVEKLGLRGLKILPHLVELKPNDKQMYGVYKEACDLGIPVLFHTGTQFHAGTKLKYSKPIDIDDVAVDLPELKIIIAHFGWPWYEEAMAVVQRNQNVYFNIAGWAPKRIPPFIWSYMKGPVKDRALLGSDYPLVSRKRIVSELSQIEIPDEIREKLCYKNALEVIPGLV